MASVAENLAPPYYAAVVRPVGGESDPFGLQALETLISTAPRLSGFLGLECGRLDDGSGGAICYWKSPEAVARWKSWALRTLLDEAAAARPRPLEEACAITVTRVARRLFRGKTPLDVTLVRDEADTGTAQPDEAA